jgi:hypothetical protein
MHSTLFQELIIHGHSRKWTTGSATMRHAENISVASVGQTGSFAVVVGQQENLGLLRAGFSNVELVRVKLP